MTERENTQPDTDTPLWRFALAFWQREGAAGLCLELQSQGWSVTRILCAGWLAREGHCYSGSEPETVTHWRQSVTASIRSLRQSLSKSDSLQLPVRQSLAKAELEAERVELFHAWEALQDQLSSLAGDQDEALALANLRKAAPATDNRTNEMTDAMITQLARLMLDTPTPASDTHGSPGS
ncbi:TIGR02444 family protein [Marinobacter daqiaonensis]|uniref:TIGR02444 family protein n=1 Tax=Marinobacter daqiaonensis TaxID=650891 RepID=A0A1I6I2K3_9GAMM|nr:DUF2390 domain-containing protein [Marinobacter daqiaonensis]SFR60858.1 TIGR02444 family protein [Marinobacter daqiaonensis]